MLRSTLESPSRARKECRLYKCDKCHCYHLTSMPLEDYMKEKESAGQVLEQGRPVRGMLDLDGM